ncbi:MAG: TonB-dependent receptor plug domain-containing protein, partial [Steroidobacteraceae bacterium]
RTLCTTCNGRHSQFVVSLQTLARASICVAWARSALACVLLWALRGPAWADMAAAAGGDLKHMSVEELMDIRVISVGRHPEPLRQVAAAIQVITREDIRRSGASSIPEVLRLASNLQVARKNAHDWGISARGFNSSLANKLLVMIDGRTVYTPLYSGVFWDAQDYLLEDIERIEVISGPGGTLWGANAVNGVINIITRSAADSQGPYAEAAGGTQLRALAGARYGGMLNPDVSFRVYAKYFDRDEEVFPDLTGAADAWHREQGGFRFDADASHADTFSAHGDFYAGHEGVNTGGAAQTAGGNLVGRWSHVFTGEADFSLQAYYDRTHLLLPIVPFVLNGIELAPAGNLRDDLSTYDIDFQHRFALGQGADGRAWHRIVWGFGYRFTRDVVENAPAVAFLPAALDRKLFSAFVQDDIALAAHIALTVGSKLEHNDYTGFEVEPNVRLQWSWTPSQTLWSAISRAARTPSRIDRDLAEPAPPAILILQGGRNYGTEYVTAYELGYRGEISSTLTGSLSTFYNEYRDVRSTSITPGTVIPLFFANNIAGHTDGLELSARYQVADFWTLQVGYDYLQESLHVRPGQFDLGNARNETADPRHQAAVRSAVSLALHFELDASLRWVDALRLQTGPVTDEVPSYFELDTRVAWALQGLELALVGQNLLHKQHAEYGIADPTREQIQRSVYAKISWRY